MVPEGTKLMLNLRIREQDKNRALELLARQQQESLDNEERSELASYVQADNALSILKARALLALKEPAVKSTTALS